MTIHANPPDIESFFQSYVQAFERFDVDALAAHLAYPCQSVADTRSAPTVFGSPDDYRTGIEPLISAYRKLGVAQGRIRRLQVSSLAPSLAVCSVEWDINRADGSPLYQHEAVYTLTRHTGSWAIATIAFNELSRIQALLRVAA
jgi:hypothetical protein